jgi:hypothetical protein
MLLRPAAYRSAALVERLSRPIAATKPKAAIIRDHEIGLSADFAREGLRGRALYEPARAGLISRKTPFNATSFLWEQLVVDAGVPFIKVELLRDNPLFVEDVERWPEVVAARSPELIQPIETDVATRRALGGGRPSAPAGPGLRLLILYLRWFRRCAVRDYRFAQAGRPLLLRLNACWFEIGFLGYRAVLKALSLLRVVRRPTRAADGDQPH